jgi:hypothetical protein
MLGEDSASRRTMIAVSTCALMWAAVPAAHAHAGEDDDNGGAYCSATARLIHQACLLEAGDDRFLARAKCVNVADARARRECLTDAKASRAEGTKSCHGTLAWRRSWCTRLGEARYDPPFTPDLFDTNYGGLSNPNPYFPLGIGQRRVYEGEGERTDVEVLNATKLIEGVTCIVVRDLVYVGGFLKEATDDWFAAGRDGSTWYCGEEVKDYETFEGDLPRQPELVSRDGTFKHGRDGDKAGIAMPSRAQVGQVWREEFSLGNAEDVSEVLSTTYAYGQDAELDRLVPRELAMRMCTGRDCIVIRAVALLEPNQYALKYHARGIGVFLETKPVEGKTLQLVDCNFDARCASLPRP